METLGFPDTDYYIRVYKYRITHIAVAFSRYRCVVISTKVLLLVGVALAGVAYRLAYSAGSTLLQNLIPVNFGPASTAYHGAKQQVTEITVRSILSLLCSPRASSFAGTTAPRVNVLCIQCLRQQPGLPGHGPGQQLSRQADTTA